MDFSVHVETLTNREQALYKLILTYLIQAVAAKIPGNFGGCFILPHPVAQAGM